MSVHESIAKCAAQMLELPAMLSLDGKLDCANELLMVCIQPLRQLVVCEVEMCLGLVASLLDLQLATLVFP